jgi:hypothetical protein
MLIIGCDYHPSWQQVCWMDTETGETAERKLEHVSGEAEKFYRGLRCLRCLGWSRLGTANGLWRWPPRRGMRYGSERRRRFGPVIHGNRSMTGGMPRSF